MAVLYLESLMRKMELVKAFTMEQENEHLRAYKEMFPGARPNIFQMDLIAGTVTDAQAWRKTLEFWAGNDYRPQSIFKMLDYYKQVKSGTVQTFADTSKAKMHVGKNTSPPEPLNIQCSICSDIGQVWGNGGMIPCTNCRVEVAA